MIYLLHGDDVVSSRKQLTALAEGLKQIFLEGKSLTVNALEDELVSKSLFGEEKAVIIENLFSSPRKKELLAFLKSFTGEILVIVWEGKKIPKNSFSSVKNILAEEFTLPTYYFQFLDSLSPPNKKRVVLLFHDLLRTYPAEQLLFSLTKRVRQLLMVGVSSKAEEITKMPPWMQQKLKQQEKAWKGKSLVSFYRKLQQTEIKLKTGLLPVELSKHLDIVILTSL